MCQMDFEDKITGCPPCQKEYVDAVHLRPCLATPLILFYPISFIFIFYYKCLSRWRGRSNPRENFSG